MINKNYIWIIGLFILLCVGNVEGAKVVDDGRSSKSLRLEIYDCINFTISASGSNSTGLSFDGCSDKGSNTWFCDCGTSKFWNLTMRSDRTILRDPKEYDMHIDYNLYNVYSNSDDFEVEDWGDYVDVNGASIKYTNSSSKCQAKKDIVYINNVTETIKYVDVIEYRDRNHTIYINVENTSRLDECNALLINVSSDNLRLNTTLSEELIKSNKYLIVLLGVGILCALLISMLILILTRNKRGDANAK